MTRKFMDLSVSEQSLFDSLAKSTGQTMTIEAKMGLIQGFGLDMNDPVVLSFFTGNYQTPLTQPMPSVSENYPVAINPVTTKTDITALKGKEMSYANSEHLIVIQNRLLHAISNLTLNERRLILFLSPIVRKEVGMDKNKKQFSVKAQDFAMAYNIHNNNVYKILEDTADTILEKAFWFWNFKENNHVLEKTHKTGLSWVTKCDYLKKQGTIVVSLHEDVIEMLTVFDKRTGNYWTQYDKEWITKLGSYGIVMLEMALSSLENKGYYTVEHLREKFDCVETYEKFSDFKLYVLNKAIKEIHEHTPIKISYTVSKKGRSVAGLNFTFIDTAPKPLPQPKPKKETNQDPPQNNIFANFKMSKKQLSFFASKIAKVTGQDIETVIDELTNVHLQGAHIERLKLLDFVPTEWYTEDETKDHLTQAQIDELRQKSKKSAKNQQNQEQLRLEQEFNKILQYAEYFVLANKHLINRATIEGFYLQDQDYESLVQLWKERLMDKDKRQHFAGIDEILIQ